MDFVHCSYAGQRTTDGRRFDGVGRYTFANGDVYVGGMQDGQFHGQGVLFFRTMTDEVHDAPPTAPAASETASGSDDALKAFLNQSAPTAAAAAAPSEDAGSAGWSGQYRGVWEHGRHVAGQYVFQDGLVYGNEHTDHRHFASALWNYCHGSDRRLWAEYLENVAPVLPHEALLGGAKVLHQRKQATAGEAAAAAAAANNTGAEVGEGLPMVLPNAFVQARAAPAFASGQLVGVQDPRVVRWTAAAAITPSSTAAESVEMSPEMIESTIALQLALSNSTEEVRANEHGKGAHTRSSVAVPEQESANVDGGAPRKLNLTVCRVKDVEDVNRVLVPVSPAPS